MPSARKGVIGLEGAWERRLDDRDKRGPHPRDGNQDSYATGRDLGVQAGSTSNFRADRARGAAAYDGLSRATREWRGKSRSGRDADRDRFWGDRKEAEELRS